MSEQQILIPVSAEVFWQQMKTVIKEVLMERNLIASFPESNKAVPKLLKMKEICQLFQVSKPTVYDWMRKGELRSIKIESRRFFHSTDVEKLISRNRSQK